MGRTPLTLTLLVAASLFLAPKLRAEDAVEDREAAAQPHTLPSDRMASADLLEGAYEAEKAGDFERSWSLLQQSLAADPDNTDARMMRSKYLFAAGSGAPNADQQRQLYQAAADDLQRVIALEPDKPYAREMLGVLLQDLGMLEPLIAQPEVACSEEARATMELAEAAFANKQWEQAMAAYQAATAACPDNPIYWTYYGDALFVQRRLDEAEALYLRALEADPCAWSAHRFLADALAQQGDVEGSIDHLLHAVTCNPGYEMGWASLAQMLSATGREVFRGGLDWTEVLPEGDEGVLMMAMPDTPGDAEREAASTALNMYRIGTVAFRAKDPDIGPLALERARVQVALRALADTGSQPPYEDTFLRVLELHRRAVDAEMLDASIFMLHLTRELVPEFMAYRDEHQDVLIRFVEEVLIAAPPGPDAAPSKKQRRQQRKRERRESKQEPDKPPRRAPAGTPPAMMEAPCPSISS